MRQLLAWLLLGIALALGIQNYRRIRLLERAVEGGRPSAARPPTASSTWVTSGEERALREAARRAEEVHRLLEQGKLAEARQAARELAQSLAPWRSSQEPSKPLFLQPLKDSLQQRVRRIEPLKSEQERSKP